MVIWVGVLDEFSVECVEYVRIKVSHVAQGDRGERHGSRYNFYSDLKLNQANLIKTFNQYVMQQTNLAWAG